MICLYLLYKNDIIKIRIGIFESLFEKDASKLQEEMRDKLDDNLRGKITVSDLATFKDDILK